jgi:hypothetical protein
VQDAVVTGTAPRRPPLRRLLPVYALTVGSRLLTRLPPRSFGRLLGALARPRSGVCTAAEVAALRRAVDHVQTSDWPLVRKGCLTRGLTLFWLLRRRGVDVALAFGVGTPEGETAAHCWLVRDGEPYLEQNDESAAFTEVWRIGAGA